MGKIQTTPHGEENRHILTFLTAKAVFQHASYDPALTTQYLFLYCFDITCSMLFLWPFDINIYLSIHIYTYCMSWIYMQKFLSSIASKILLPCLNGLPLSVAISEHGQLHYSNPRIEKCFSAELLFVFCNWIWFKAAFLCFCVFVTTKEKWRPFSVCKFVRSRERQFPCP